MKKRLLGLGLLLALGACGKSKTDFVMPAPKPPETKPIHVPGPGQVEGRVRNEGNRQPLPGVSVALREESVGRIVATGTSGAGGQFGFRGVPAGRYFLDFDLRGYGALRGVPVTVVSDRATLFDALMRILPGELGGTVSDAADGHALAGARVTVTEVASGARHELVTDDGGHYRLSDLMPGRFRLDFAYDDYLPLNGQTVEVRPGESTGFDARLTRNRGSLSGTVTDYDDGRALPGVAVTIRQGSPSGDAVATKVTDAYGIYAAEELAPGDYYLDFDLDGYLPLRGRGVTVQTERRAVLNVAMPSTLGKLQGQVINATDARGLSGTTVTLRGGGNVIGTTTTDGNGYYAFRGLNPGDYRVDFAHEGYVAVSDVATRILAHETTRLDQVLSQQLDPNQWRIVLTWTDGKPGGVKDVDSYLAVPNGRTIYYQQKDAGEGANLDVDDTDWGGPETTTITSARQGTYTFYVHNYDTPCDKQALGNSEIVVRVYKGGDLLKTYQVPPGRGLTYELFNIKSGRLRDVLRYNDALHAETGNGNCVNTEPKSR